MIDKTHHRYNYYVRFFNILINILIILYIINFSEIEQYCIALYDYDATCDEELSFLEGDIMKVLRKEPHDVDDGWWEGELRNQRGIFPSLVVEPCGPDGSPLTPQVKYPNIVSSNIIFINKF